MERTDGFTPLHLVAARANVHDVHLGLIRLGEDTQVSFFVIICLSLFVFVIFCLSLLFFVCFCLFWQPF